MKTSAFFISLLLLGNLILQAQVSVNTTGDPPHGSAMLDVSAWDKGFLIPRMTLSELQAILTPAKGLLTYNVDDNHFYVNRGTPASPFWVMVNTEWGINGSNIFFLGSNVGIGTSSPGTKLDIRGNSPDDGIALQVGNSDLSHSLMFFGGRQNDPNPFIRWKQGDAFKFMTDQAGESEKMRITSDGKVGIGISTPTACLHVAENSPGYTGVFGMPISNYYSGANVSIGDDNESSALYLGQSETHKGFLIWDFNGDPAFSYLGLGSFAGLHKLILQPAGGDVGIGTLYPTALLEVEYDVHNTSQIGNGSSNPNYFYHIDQPEDNDGQATIQAFRGSNENDGELYEFGWSNYAILGRNWTDDQYSFGVAGYQLDGGTRNGGVLGSEEYATYWGSLAYRTSSSMGYGGYFTSYTQGAGRSNQTTESGIGIGSWGSLMGADIHGKIYGLYVEGENYAVYSHGIVFKDNLDIHLQDNGSGANTVLYTFVSTDVCIQTCGVATLSNGTASIVFDQAFTASVSPDEPVVVTVTPAGNSNGVYLSEVSDNGFTVIENNNGKSNLTINYIAIGRRIGYENPSLPHEVVNASYTGKIARGLHNDADSKTNGEGLYYENGELIVGVPPSTIPDLNKPVVSTEIPRLENTQKKTLNDTGKGLIGD